MLATRNLSQVSLIFAYVLSNSGVDSVPNWKVAAGRRCLLTVNILYLSCTSAHTVLPGYANGIIGSGKYCVLLPRDTL